MNDMFRQAEIESAQAKELRPHQVKALDMIRQSLGLGNRRTVLQMPTGSGKTYTAAAMIQGALAKGRSVLFTVPRITLVDQAVREFEGQGIRHIGVIQADHPRRDDLAPVQVASVDTLARRGLPEKPGLAIIDEAHLRSVAVERMAADWPDLHMVGLSATPWAKGMGRLWQDLQIPITMQELVDQGYLSQFVVYAPDVPDLSGVKTLAGDYHEGDAAEAMSEGKLVANVVQTWLERGEGRPTLVFGVNRAHAQTLQAEFERAGVAAGYCDAYTDRAEMQLYANRFRDGEYQVFCSVRKLTTGVDWAVSCIVDAAPTKSEALHVQKIGRGMRVNPGTEDLIVLDHAGNSLRLGLVTDIHHATLDATERGKQEVRAKAEKLPKECANCGALHAGKVCPFCGHERKPVSGVETVDGELIEVTGKVKPATKEEKQRWYSGLLWISAQRGYSSGWAAHKYREKFTVWPRLLDDKAVQPAQDIQNWVKSRQIAFAKKRQSRGV